MQSINEELQTINAEIQGKNETLARLNSDLQNLMESTQIATLFLDTGLRVTGFTSGMREVFHLRDGDRGRPINEIATRVHYPQLQDDVKQVLRTLAPIERVLRAGKGVPTYLLRVRPYRTVDNVIDGTVLTFIDITEREQPGSGARAPGVDRRMGEGRDHRLLRPTAPSPAGTPAPSACSAIRPEAMIGQSLAALLPAGQDEQFNRLRGRVRRSGGRAQVRGDLASWRRQHDRDRPVVVAGEGCRRQRPVGLGHRPRRDRAPPFRARAARQRTAPGGDPRTDLDGPGTDRLRRPLRAGEPALLRDRRAHGARTVSAACASTSCIRTTCSRTWRWRVRCWPSAAISSSTCASCAPTVAWSGPATASPRCSVATACPRHIISAVLDITKQKLASQHVDLMLDELNHRVKNTLATVQAIAMQTLARSTTMEAFRTAFGARLLALSNTHNLLAHDAWTGAQLRDIVGNELAPYLRGTRCRRRAARAPGRRRHPARPQDGAGAEHGDPRTGDQRQQVRGAVRPAR